MASLKNLFAYVFKKDLLRLCPSKVRTSCTTPWSQPTSDMCTVVREGAHKFWSFLGSFFVIMTKLMGSWAHSFNSWALLLGRHWTHGLICPKNCKNFKSWALSFLSIHEQWSNAPIWNILIRPRYKTKRLGQDYYTQNLLATNDETESWQTMGSGAIGHWSRGQQGRGQEA